MAEPRADIQRAMLNDFGKRTIRMDVRRVCNMEMQTVNCGDLAKRTRFYSATIDSNQLRRGMDYEKLKPVYVIFICKFDPFGEGFYRYSFENVCAEDPALKLNDQSYRIFFNTAGKKGDIPETLRQLLSYMNDRGKFDEEEPSELIRRIDTAMTYAMRDDEWRRNYMTFELKQMDARREGRDEGRAEGRAEERLTTVIASVKALMANLRVTAKQALDYMNIPAHEQEKYLKALQGS